MSEKPRKKVKSSFTATEVGVLIEDLHSRLDVFADGQKALHDKVDLVWETQGRTMERVTMIEVTQRKILHTLKGHDTRLSRLEDAVLK